jgi:hypothetical protein
MKKTLPRPKWYILYLLTFLYLFVFWLQLKESISDAGHIWVEAGLTCVYFGLVFAWLKSNEYAMWIEDREKSERRIGQMLPAWVVVLISHFGDLFKGLR